jgi:hypothetical protein
VTALPVVECGVTARACWRSPYGKLNTLARVLVETPRDCS